MKQQVGLIVLLSWPAITGCSTVSRKPATSLSAPLAPMIAVRYDFPAQSATESDGTSLDAFSRDGARLSELGFNGLVGLQSDASQQAAFARRASLSNLSVSSRDHELEIFIRTGALPVGCDQISQLADRILHKRSPGKPPFLVSSAPPRTPPARDRAKSIAELLRARNVILVLGSVETGVVDASQLAVINGGVSKSDETEPSYVLQWLGEYHSALAAGKCAGILFDRPQDLPGLFISAGAKDDATARARLTGLTELMSRVDAWGKLIIGSTASPWPTSAPDSLKSTNIRLTELRLSLSVLQSESRCFLLVVNPSPSSVVREELAIWDATVKGRSIRRLVQIPWSIERPAGRIVDSHDGQLRWNVELRPGDAELYEIITNGT